MEDRPRQQVIVVVTDNARLWERCEALVRVLGAAALRFPKQHYQSAPGARIRLMAGVQNTPAGVVIDVQSGIKDPFGVDRWLRESGVPVVMVLPEAQRDAYQRATRGSRTLYGVLTAAEAENRTIGDLLRRALEPAARKS